MSARPASGMLNWLARSWGFFRVSSPARTYSLETFMTRPRNARVLTVASEGQADLVKPFTPSQLMAAVRRRLARR